MRTGRPWETVRVKRLSSSKEKKGLEPCRHLSYLHERLREWPECIAGERKQGGVVCGLSAYVCRGGVGGGRKRGEGELQLRGQQLILSRETGSARSGRGR